MPIIVPAATCFPSDLLVKLPAGVPGRRWLIACTMPRQEKSLANDLLRRGIPFYLPLQSKILRSGNRKTRSYLPVFSGFIFLYADESERIGALGTGRIAAFLEVRDEEELHNNLRSVEAAIRSGKHRAATREGFLPGQRTRMPGATVPGSTAQGLRVGDVASKADGSEQ